MEEIWGQGERPVAGCFILTALASSLLTLCLKLKAAKLTAIFVVVVVVILLKLWLISLVFCNELIFPLFSYG